MAHGIHDQVQELLLANNQAGAYPLSLVCSIDGLPIVSAGEGESDEHIAAFAALFDDIVRRAVRDLGFRKVEEVTLLDPGRGRYIVRPLVIHGRVAFFLVVRAGVRASWRRNISQLSGELERVLEPLTPTAEEEE